MTNNNTTLWHDYFELCKPKVVFLMLITALVGMLLAIPFNNLNLAYFLHMLIALVGIALCAGAAATLNHVIDRQIDLKMKRTHGRPIAQGRVDPQHALVFALLQTILGVGALAFKVNVLTALLTFLSLIGYAFIYTVLLKRATPQNIVIGGLAGAAPPLLGWTAMTGSIDHNALILALIIFTWTPPHFWALSIFRCEDYAKANIPMLPVTHGIPYTKLSIFLYTLLLTLITLLPCLTHMSHILYALCMVALNANFIKLAFQLLRAKDSNPLARKMFQYSITYLFALFGALLLDHAIAEPLSKMLHLPSF